MASANSFQQRLASEPRECVICRLQTPLRGTNFCRNCKDFAYSPEFRQTHQKFERKKEEILGQIQHSPELFVNRYINLLALVDFMQNN